MVAAGRVLVVGYGNPLCGDDGAGPAVVERLASDARLAGAELWTRHQLTPELATDIAGASLVVLVDAVAGPPPGDIAVAGVGHAPERGSAWSHHIDPEGLVALALELFGAAPPVYTVCVAAGAMNAGDGLSPAVAAALPAAADAVVRIVEAHAHA
ncbi:MAG TPA: hydrogenase maturation protease [Candidatus Limnocylindrales bacterium]|nr:hydrogenase maturation protease [Candidatus Limnocylindrales bacterium]